MGEGMLVCERGGLKPLTHPKRASGDCQAAAHRGAVFCSQEVSHRLCLWETSASIVGSVIDRRVKMLSRHKSQCAHWHLFHGHLDPATVYHYRNTGKNLPPCRQSRGGYSVVTEGRYSSVPGSGESCPGRSLRYVLEVIRSSQAVANARI